MEDVKTRLGFETLFSTFWSRLSLEDLKLGLVSALTRLGN